jgi:Fic family protein
MQRSDFTESAPGHLVQATVTQRSSTPGTSETVTVQGLAFVPDPLPPRVDRERFIGRVYDSLSAAERHLHRLDGVAATIPNPHLVAGPFIKREAQLSSRIENTVASAEEIALAEASEPGASEDAQEVWNYVRALDHGLRSSLPLCDRLFHEMHAILLSGVRGEDKTPGHYRTVQAYISGGGGGGRFENARFVPPPPLVVPSLMKALSDYLNPDGVHPKRSVRLPGLVETAMAHYQFESIHPYRDGNGRLGRLIIALSLCKDGTIAKPLVYVSAYFDRHRSDYYNLLLRVSTHGDWESWVRFFCEAVASQADDGVRRIRKLLDLRDRLIERVNEPRSSALPQRLVNKLFERPAVRTIQVAEMLGITRQGAHKLVQKLVSKGVLHDVGGKGYSRVFVARDILACIETDTP